MRYSRSDEISIEARFDGSSIRALYTETTSRWSGREPIGVACASVGCDENDVRCQVTAPIDANGIENAIPHLVFERIVEIGESEDLAIRAKELVGVAMNLMGEMRECNYDAIDETFHPRFDSISASYAIRESVSSSDR